MFDRVIFHIDVNSAFLSWEAVYRMRELGIDIRIGGIRCARSAETRPRGGGSFSRNL